MRAAVLAVALATVLGLAPAFADGSWKVVKLKNGRTVQGELVDETQNDYILKTSGGEMRIAKASIASVEDAPRPGASAPKPESKPDAKPSTPDARPAETKPDTTPAPSAPQDDLETAKKVLLEILQAPDPDARARAVEDARKKVSPRALVAIAGEQPVGVHHEDPPEAAAAVEVLEASPAEPARAALASGLKAVPFTPLVPGALLRAIARIGFDDAGAVEGALAAKGDEVLKARGSLEPLAKLLQRQGTSRSIGALSRWLVSAAASADSTKATVQAMKAILARAQDPTVAAAPLLALLDPGKPLPDWPRLGAAFEVLGSPARRELGDAIRRVLDAAEASRDTADPDARRKALASAWDALATIGDGAARDRLWRSLTEADDEATRVNVLYCMRRLPFSNDADFFDFLGKLVDYMAAGSRTTKEADATAQALAAITEQKLKNDPAAWRQWIAAHR